MIKKAIKTTFLGILLLVALALSACLNKEGYSIKLCDFSDGGSGVTHKVEYSLWSEGRYTDYFAKDRLILSVGNLNIDAEYVNSEINTFEYYETHLYKDKNNNYFSVTDNGKLCYYLAGSDLNTGNEKICTEAECISIAREFLDAIVDSSAYTLHTEFKESSQTYVFTFEKTVGGFRSADRAEIWVKQNGNISIFSSFMLGEIPNDAVVAFDTAEIEKQIVASLDEKYEKVKEKYDTVSYEMRNYTLTRTEEGEYALVCSVDVRCIDHYGEYDSVCSDRLTFFIR